MMKYWRELIPTTGQSTNNVLDNEHVSKYIIYRTYFYNIYIKPILGDR